MLYSGGFCVVFKKGEVYSADCGAGFGDLRHCAALRTAYECGGGGKLFLDFACIAENVELPFDLFEFPPQWLQLVELLELEEHEFAVFAVLCHFAPQGFDLLSELYVFVEEGFVFVAQVGVFGHCIDDSELMARVG